MTAYEVNEGLVLGVAVMMVMIDCVVAVPLLPTELVLLEGVIVIVVLDITIIE